MKTIFILLCAILLSLSCFSLVSADEKPQKMIFMTLNYKDNAVTVKDIAVGNGFYSPFVEDDNLNLDKCSIKVFNDTEIFSDYFYVDNKRFEDVIDPVTGDISGKMDVLNDADFSVIIPLYDIKRIEINCPTNKIVLDHDINLTKPMVIPVYGSAKSSADSQNTQINKSSENSQVSGSASGIVQKAESSEDSDSQEVSADLVNTNSNAESASESTKAENLTGSASVSEKKSFFLMLIDIIENVFHYIFG